MKNIIEILLFLTFILYGVKKKTNREKAFVRSIKHQKTAIA